MSSATRNAVYANQNNKLGGYMCVDWEKENIEIYDYIMRGFEQKSLYLTMMPC